MSGEYTYMHRTGNHLCVRCGKELPNGYDKTNCVECRKIIAQNAKERRDRLKAQGICYSCGKNKPKPGRKNCEECSQKVLERKNIYLKRGICFHCGKNPIMGDEKKCPECRAREISARIKKMEESEDYRNNLRQKSVESHKRSKERRKENGICTICGKRKADEGYVTCEICRIKTRKPRKAIPREMRYEFGLCYTCGNKLDGQGRICNACSQRVAKNLPKSQGNAQWRRDNDAIFGKFKYKS